jgi:hypothetical protein
MSNEDPLYYQLPKLQEIQGTFQFNGITFKGGYRFGSHPYTGGFAKCLRIYHGKDGKLQPHDYFGDDKFEVESVYVRQNQVYIMMKYPLNHKDNFMSNTGEKIIILTTT